MTRIEIIDVEVDAATPTAMQQQLNAERHRRATVTEAALYTAQQGHKHNG